MPPIAPEVLKPRTTGIPEYLKYLNAWVVWRLEWREGSGDKPGSWTKPPRQVNGQMAKSNDPNTWASFEVALDAYERGGWAGIGIMLEGSDLIGVDLDDKEGAGLLFDAENKPTPYLAEILAGLDTYAEVSPSGRGVRLFARGTIPQAGRRGAVEMYGSGSPRFMTVTGRRLSSSSGTIEERTEALAGFHARYIAPEPREEKPAPTPQALPKTRRTAGAGKSITPKSAVDRGVSTPADMTDAELLEVAQNARNGAKFTGLWGGDLSAYGGDHSAADMALASLLLFVTGGDTARSDRLFRSSGLYRQKWDDRHHANGETYGEGTLRRALAGMTEFYKPGGADVKEQIERLQKHLERVQSAPEAAPGAELAAFNLTDAGNAERLIAFCGDDVRFVIGLGWRVWDGKRWAPDELAVTERARDTVRALYAEASKLLADAHKEPDADLRKQLARHAEELARFATKSESTRALAAMTEQAKTFPQVKTFAGSFYIQPWRVAFLNGVWDRGEWRGHQRSDLIEHLLPVAYDPKADRADWYALLDRMTGGDTDLARTLQDVAGYALSGASTMRILPWLYGPKGTGKSTFCELLQTALGAAGKTLDASLLSGDRDTERLGAAVRGVRAVFLPELGRKRIDAELLKMLAGSDRLPGRELYGKETFSVSPTWAVMAVSNDPPTVNAYDDALRDRVMALPFLHSLETGGKLEFTGGRRLEEVRRDPSSSLLAGFVSWAVDGLTRVEQAQEIHRAQVVTSHTRLFWEDLDPLTPFWEGLDKQEIERGMSSKALHTSYLQWRENEQVPGRPLHGKSFAAACRAAGLESKKNREGSMVWFRPQPSFGLCDGGTEEKGSFSESSPKNKDIGKVTENRGFSSVPPSRIPPPPKPGETERTLP